MKITKFSTDDENIKELIIEMKKQLHDSINILCIMNHVLANFKDNNNLVCFNFHLTSSNKYFAHFLDEFNKLEKINE